MQQVLFESEISHRFFAHWDSLRRNHALPARADLDPLQLRTLLPHVFLIDMLDNPRDFRFRLFGTRIAEEVGADHTGKLIGEVLQGESLASVRHLLEVVADEGCGVRSQETLLRADRPYARVEILRLPLAADGRNVDMITGVFSRIEAAALPPAAKSKVLGWQRCDAWERLAVG